VLSIKLPVVFYIKFPVSSAVVYFAKTGLVTVFIVVDVLVLVVKALSSLFG